MMMMMMTMNCWTGAGVAFCQPPHFPDSLQINNQRESQSMNAVQK